ncbi:unnamed protein product [Calicophoron daubneyi]|uniref:ATP receptor n=1 Tax=Calicophoron daubneyi TaxID=300641 RepID=A0AAV2TYD5_CALDB
MWWNKGYQSFDRAISGVAAEINGIAWTESTYTQETMQPAMKIYDDGEYQFRTLQNAGFYLATGINSWKVQKLGYCPETKRLPDARCFKDTNCPAGETAGISAVEPDGTAVPEEEIDIDEDGHGVFTGRCINLTGTCEVYAWCPILDEALMRNYLLQAIPLIKPPNILTEPYYYFNDLGFLEQRRRLVETMPEVESPFFDIVNFTIFIKNVIEFPYFDVKRRNVLPWMSELYLKQCTYEPEHPRNKYCPVFRMGDMIRLAGADSRKLIRFGGVMAITIDWQCDLDWSVDYCLPNYAFRQLDRVEESEFHSVSNSSDAALGEGAFKEISVHFGRTEGRSRLLIKTSGIEFLIRATGRAGKFSFLQFTMNIGSGLALLSIATIMCDLVVFHFTHDRKRYREATCDNSTLIRLVSLAAAASLPASRRKQFMRQHSNLFTNVENPFSEASAFPAVADQQEEKGCFTFTRPSHTTNFMPSNSEKLPRADGAHGVTRLESEKNKEEKGDETLLEYHILGAKQQKISVDSFATSMCSSPFLSPPHLLKDVESPMCSSEIFY